MPEKVILFLENAAEADHYFSQKPDLGEATVLFAATSGSAIYAVERRGEQCLLPIEFEDPERFIELEGENYPHCQRLFRKLDRYFLEHSTLLKGKPTDQGLIEFIYLHYFKIQILDRIYGRFLALRRLIEQMQPDKIAFFDLDTKPSTDQPNFLWDPLDTKIVSLFADTLHIPAIRLQAPPQCHLCMLSKATAGLS